MRQRSWVWALVVLGLAAACGSSERRQSPAVAGSAGQPLIAGQGGLAGGPSASGGNAAGGKGGASATGGMAGERPLTEAGAGGASAGAPSEAAAGATDGGAGPEVPRPWPPPQGWRCSPEAWGDGACHCGCGAIDWDCREWTLEECEVCNDPASCSSQECPGIIDPALVTRCVVPFGWACSSRQYNDGKVCDCGCGLRDPDCADASVESCDVCDRGCAGVPCPGAIAADDNSLCAIPPGWRCGELYADGECDCGCGALDLDCDSAGIEACERCDYGCAGFTCPATIDPEDNTTCNGPPPGWLCLIGAYNDGAVCHCGCGAPDLDCETADVTDCDVCNSFGSCSTAACPGTIQAGYSSSCVLP
jgi:hypothetical protein